MMGLSCVVARGVAWSDIVCIQRSGSDSGIETAGCSRLGVGSSTAMSSNTAASASSEGATPPKSTSSSTVSTGWSENSTRLGRPRPRVVLGLDEGAGSSDAPRGWRLVVRLVRVVDFGVPWMVISASIPSESTMVLTLRVCLGVFFGEDVALLLVAVPVFGVPDLGGRPRRAGVLTAVFFLSPASGTVVVYAPRLRVGVSALKSLRPTFS
ncbi:hypothetical protein LZ30DRAFT_706215 [Colletotrichum cereale]|nr:hypothetical protein LZ30DRAFT_706215 [Colletotrichum cereale]